MIELTNLKVHLVKQVCPAQSTGQHVMKTENRNPGLRKFQKEDNERICSQMDSGIQ